MDRAEKRSPMLRRQTGLRSLAIPMISGDMSTSPAIYVSQKGCYLCVMCAVTAHARNDIRYKPDNEEECPDS
ncbi:hypothetical protein CDAR_433091 [Caerostris darwini]|uniref:Uncharacterized protein n=1 Tax=Caerostris darwini TaxID=1538125 RepID=A0AAV4QKL2_9ARAC|nr:hypothetical protein CDAR_433091 [Caerostris darwini]